VSTDEKAGSSEGEGRVMELRRARVKRRSGSREPEVLGFVR
jgi:hypothetical protein